MAKYRMVRINFWMNPIVGEEMTADEKLFYIYLLTNQCTTQIGIYRILKKQIAVDLGFSLEYIESLMERFFLHHKLIRYNSETREIAIKNWGIEILSRGGKPVLDCIYSELKEVMDTTLISYVLEFIQKQEIRSLYEAFCEPENMYSDKEGSYERDTNIHTYEDVDDTPVSHNTIRGQEEKEKEKQKQQQKALNPNIENNSELDYQRKNQKTNHVKAIIEFWDNNGFGLSNVNAKEQLLSWLDDSNFLQPENVVLKALAIACSNNKRKLNYVVGILKNWENESLLTVEEIDSFQENQKSNPKYKQSTHLVPSGRDIPCGVDLDLTAGEEK